MKRSSSTIAIMAHSGSYRPLRRNAMTRRARRAISSSLNNGPRTFVTVAALKRCSAMAAVRSVVRGRGEEEEWPNGEEEKRQMCGGQRGGQGCQNEVVVVVGAPSVSFRDAESKRWALRLWQRPIHAARTVVQKRWSYCEVEPEKKHKVRTNNCTTVWKWHRVQPLSWSGAPRFVATHTIYELECMPDLLTIRGVGGHRKFVPFFYRPLHVR